MCTIKCPATFLNVLFEALSIIKVQFFHPCIGLYHRQSVPIFEISALPLLRDSIFSKYDTRLQINVYPKAVFIKDYFSFSIATFPL